MKCYSILPLFQLTLDDKQKTVSDEREREKNERKSANFKQIIKLMEKSRLMGQVCSLPCVQTVGWKRKHGKWGEGFPSLGDGER